MTTDPRDAARDIVGQINAYVASGGTLSTSAQLRQTQQALAASQADLTRVERQLGDAERDRHRALAERDEALEVRNAAIDSFVRIQGGLDRAEAVDEAARWRKRYAVQVDSLMGELEQLRNRPWIVARDAGRDCSACDHGIRRGEAYEPVPGGDPDTLRHIHCPDVFDEYGGWWCPTCRALVDPRHPHPYTDVHITLTRRDTANERSDP